MFEHSLKWHYIYLWQAEAAGLIHDNWYVVVSIVCPFLTAGELFLSIDHSVPFPSVCFFAICLAILFLMFLRQTFRSRRSVYQGQQLAMIKAAPYRAKMFVIKKTSKI